MAATGTPICRELIDSADLLLFLALRHGTGAWDDLAWELARVRAQTALRVISACTPEQAKQALDLVCNGEPESIAC